MHTILAESLSFNSDVGKVCPVRANMPQKRGCAVSFVLLEGRGHNQTNPSKPWGGRQPLAKMGETLFLHEQGVHMWGKHSQSVGEGAGPSKIEKWTPLGQSNASLTEGS